MAAFGQNPGHCSTDHACLLGAKNRSRRDKVEVAKIGAPLYWPRGKVLGGSSAINALLYVRGHRADYDAWAAAGNAGWSYDDVLPFFKKSETHATTSPRGC